MTRCGQKKNEAENYCGNNGVNETSNDRKQQTDFILFERLVKTKGVIRSRKGEAKICFGKTYYRDIFRDRLGRRKQRQHSEVDRGQKFNRIEFLECKPRYNKGPRLVVGTKS